MGIGGLLCSGIPEYRWRNWAEDDEGITGDALIEHVENMFRTLRNLDVSDGIAKISCPRCGRRKQLHEIRALLRQVINKISADIN